MTRIADYIIVDGRTFERVRELVVTIVDDRIIAQIMLGNASDDCDTDCKQMEITHFDMPNAWKYVLSIIANGERIKIDDIPIRVRVRTE